MTVRSMWCHFVLLLHLSTTISLGAAEISCRNEDGNPIDWFVLYKLPKFTEEESAGLGLEYMYLDSLTHAWRLSKYLINMTQGGLGQTLKQLYETYESKNNSVAYAIYNDEVPHSKAFNWKKGHTKGFLLLDKSQGFWVIHSVPLFPPFLEDGYGYPATGKEYGQTAICVTFKYDQFTEIDQQLLSYNPSIYNCFIPDIFQDHLPNLQKLCARSRLPPVPPRHLSKLQSAHGETFLHFAKSHLFVDDIYVAWVAQELKTHLLVESWQHSGHSLPSNCSLQYHVYNIHTIETPLKSTFNSINDHSKWCVSKSPEDQWTCIGDLNRAAEQAWRSGGFICTQNQNIYKAFRNLVMRYESCNDSSTLR
ncbi:deoxyribonuclease-2-beta [Nothoprocta perdicaria]|uniref:deoxyribonuclease II n=1 Tax=Nothoprocta perdicaria TaxID=30464 RepID=A0A8C6YPF0_NOTPE|nr:deoxyribonuclease-2-beta [Nothoprocta perdicaria]XP_025893839.1 deoxyribonuclease-2-beta [Nothoprocta perdicaria]XP_025893840.1 deoxyribonuclease-2-beta [Nothoprocta perdicaria]XP_025893841.1 deoxyribonuclease-2-beta [Nothoprocta perdicaria]